MLYLVDHQDGKLHAGFNYASAIDADGNVKCFFEVVKGNTDLDIEIISGDLPLQQSLYPISTSPSMPLNSYFSDDPIERGPCHYCQNYYGTYPNQNYLMVYTHNEVNEGDVLTYYAQDNTVSPPVLKKYQVTITDIENQQSYAQTRTSVYQKLTFSSSLKRAFVQGENLHITTPE